MSQPSPDYVRNYSFTDHSAQQPNVPQPGSWLDIEFNDIRDILNNTGSRLSEIQQDDGKINGDAFSTYTYNQIAQNVATALNLEADYATKLYVTSQLSDYLQTSIAQSTFLTIATAASTYQPISAMSSYATQSWVESQGYLTGSLNYLPLSGGTITGNLIVNGEGSSGHYEATEMYVTRNDATGTSANAYGALYNGGLEIGDSAGNWAELTTAHLRFGDGTIQTTAATAGAFLPLTGGTVTGGTTFSGGVELSGGMGFQIYDAELYFDQQIRSYNGTTENELIIDSSQINLQNGATLSNLTNTQLRFEDGITDITIDATGIKFPNPYFNSGLFRGSFDSGRSSYNGISLICTQGIELNWQAGYLKALNGSSVVPINVESDIVLSKYVETGEGLPPAHTITTTISLNGGISFNGNEDWNDHGFNLNTGGVSGSPQSDYNWGLDYNGVGGNDPNNNSFGLNFGGVGGSINGSLTWGIGVSGAGGDNDDRQYWNVGTNGYSAEYEYNTCSLSSSGVQGFDNNTEGGWSFGLSGATFANGTVINSPSAGDSGLSQSGNIAHSDYPKEIQLVINGVTYAIPARIV